MRHSAYLSVMLTIIIITTTMMMLTRSDHQRPNTDEREREREADTFCYFQIGKRIPATTKNESETGSFAVINATLPSQKQLKTDGKVSTS
jgi:hypothetical protein